MPNYGLEILAGDSVNAQTGQTGSAPTDITAGVKTGPKGDPGADGTGGGGGAVTSVAGKTGVVTLAKADVGLGSVDNTADTAKPVSTAQAAADTVAKARANHTGTQVSSTISDLTEAVQDIVGAFFAAGTGVTVVYDDAGNTITLAATGGGGSTDPEVVRDTIGVALGGIGNITVTVNDAADTIVISTTATVNQTDAVLKDRANHTGSQAQSTITNLTTDLGAKAPSASPVFTGTPTGITKTHVGLGNVDNTADSGKPVSAPQQAVFDTKASDLLPTGIGPRAGSYSVEDYIYRPTRNGSMRQWRAKKAKVRTGTVARIKHSFIGHSGETFGVISGGFTTDDLVRKIRRQYAAKTGEVVGTGLVPMSYWNNASQLLDTDSRIVRTGTWAAGSGAASGGSTNVWHWLNSTAINSDATFTSDVDSSSVLVLYRNFASAVMEFSIDGAVIETVNATAAGSYAIWFRDSLPVGKHVVKVKQTTAAAMSVVGFNAYSLTDVEFNNFGIFASRASDWIDFTQGEVYSEFIFDKPDVAGVMLGGNEFLNAVPAATFLANMTTLLNQLVTDSVEFYLISGYPGSGVTDAQWLPYRKVLWDLADTYGVPLVDQYELFGTYAQANANGLYADPYHLNSAGLEQAAAVIADLLVTSVSPIDFGKRTVVRTAAYLTANPTLPDVPNDTLVFITP